MPDTTYTLVAVETAGIQSYIFASNRLRENVGASYLVAAATGSWAMQIARDVSKVSDLQQPINKGAPVELVYSGGGNIVLLFRDDDMATQFVRQLSRYVLLHAPGLQLTFNQTLFKWSESLSSAVGGLLQGMRARRAEQPALIGRAGVGVNIMGNSTSLPAVTMVQDADGEPWKPASAETVAKRDAAEDANKTLRKTLNLAETDFVFASELDDLGRTRDVNSTIAVVHADGDGLGVFIQNLKDDYPAACNRDYINFMQWFSEGVKQVATEAQQRMVRQILASVEGDKLYPNYKEDDVVKCSDYKKDDAPHIIERLKKDNHIQLKRRDDGKLVFPIRPLVSGGDDVTFVCDGRIALDLAMTFLNAFEDLTKDILERKMSACAGIAIVKTHYPFARAYQLADDLAGSAKQARKTYGLESSALDWHITAGGIYGDLEALREREYTVDEGQLTLRPVFTDDFDDRGLQRRSWTTISEMLCEFQICWRNHRNKAEGLRDVLRQGASATRLYQERYLSDSQSPDLPKIGGFEDSGWVDGYCGYYDALELMDKYIPLKQEQEEADPS